MNCTTLARVNHGSSLADFRCINLSIIIHRYTVYKTICFADKKNTKGLIDKLFHMSLFAVFVKFLLTFQTMASVSIVSGQLYYSIFKDNQVNKSI